MIYKFHSFNDNNISALDNHSAWFSKPKLFNDPFEGVYIDNSHEMDDREFIDFCKKNRDNHRFLNMLKCSSNIDEWLQMIYCRGIASQYKRNFLRRGVNALKKQQEYFHESGICCFIMDKGINPITNTLMWGHYGDGLKGYALGISDSLVNIFEDMIFAIPVEYEKTPPILNATEMAIDLISQNIDNLNDGEADYLLKIMNTKHEAWKYENELRFIFFDNGNRLVKYKKDSIQAIFIGEKMPSWQRAALIHIADKNNIKNIFEANINSTSYSVSFKPIVRS